MTYNGKNLVVAIVYAESNDKPIDVDVKATKSRLRELGVREKNIIVESVPTCFDLPMGVRILRKSRRISVDAYIVIGTLFKEGPTHTERMYEVVLHELIIIERHQRKPVISGLLVWDNHFDSNKWPNNGLNGHAWGTSAVEMGEKVRLADLAVDLPEGKTHFTERPAASS